MRSIFEQVACAFAYYVLLIGMMRVAGKRLAGQTTMFDLVVLISLGVVLQTTMLLPGPVNALVFVATVFGAHRGMAYATSRSQRLRRWIRGAPRPLIDHGEVSLAALADEGLSYDELLAGLRKSGHADACGVRLATLEETGEISVISMSAEKTP